MVRPFAKYDEIKYTLSTQHTPALVSIRPSLHAMTNVCSREKSKTAFMYVSN